MRKVRDYTSEMEAHLACEFLRSNDLTAEIRGSKEYSSHVLGNDKGRYDLLVADDDFANAMRLLNEIESADSFQNQQTPADASFYFKKSIISAVIAMTILPIIFNIPSIKNLMLYREHEKNPTRKLVLTVLALAAQLPAIATLYFMTKNLFD